MQTERKGKGQMGRHLIRYLRLGISGFLLLVLLAASSVLTEAREENDGGWVSFFLVCNAGMSNQGGNADNTMMAVNLNRNTGAIRLLMFTWDTFVEYEGFDVPQRIDMAYRNKGPEGSMEIFNSNFDMDIDNFISLNYLNLASMIDNYGGVTVDVSRAERNALNAMVASKKESVQAMEDTNILEQFALDLLAEEYYLSDFGPDTHLNGLQAVGFGWLQYDSVYNCCQREVKVIASLFRSISETLKEEVTFYTNESGEPDAGFFRRTINLDDVSASDLEFLMREVSPIFDMSYNNLPEEEIISITLAFARTSYLASRQGADIMDQLEYEVFPVEAREPYDMVAGALGHLVDAQQNSIKMKEFFYGEDDG